MRSSPPARTALTVRRITATILGGVLAGTLLVAGRAPAGTSPTAGTITTLAGTGVAGFSGDGGPATGAELRDPRHAVPGPAGTVYFTDTQNHRIRRIDAAGTITTVAGTGVAGYSGDGGPAIGAELQLPHALAVHPDGSVFIADSANHRIRRIATDGTITTVAGSGGEGFSGDGGPATEASLKNPKGIAFGPGGDLYISDGLNRRVRRVLASGQIVTVAGTGANASTGDGGPATQAALQLPRGLAFDSAGRLYVADSDAQRVRRIDVDGTIRTVAGSGAPGYNGDGIPALQARLSTPRSVAVDGAGRLYVADSANHRVRVVNPDGLIFTVAGTGTSGSGPNEGTAIFTALKEPRGVSVDSAGDLFIADTFNHRIRKVVGPQAAPPGAWPGDVVATAETDAVAGAGDAADDAAIWVHPTDPSLSLVIGTDKAADNLDVYDLSGRRLQQLHEDTINNVDLRTGFVLGGERADIVVTSGSDLHFYRVDPATRRLADVTYGLVKPRYGAGGVCMYRSPHTELMYAFATSASGNVEQFRLVERDGLVDAVSVRGPWDVHPEPVVVEDGEIEACAVDDAQGRLYVSEQDLTIWRYGAEPGEPTAPGDRISIGGTAEFNDGPLAADIEGLAIVEAPSGDGYVIASSQGDGTFAVYRREAPYDLVRKLKVADGPAADGCSHTDGIEAIAADLGPAFPHGLFICQDNDNFVTATTKGNQNFKLVPLERVVPLGVDSTPTTSSSSTSSSSTSSSSTSSSSTSSSSTSSSSTSSSSTSSSSTSSSTTTTTAPEPETTSSPAPVTGAKQGTPAAPLVAGSGYWMTDSAGRVYAFGNAVHHGEPAARRTSPAVDLEPTPSSAGYWVLEQDGRVHAYGAAASLGGVEDGLRPGERATSLSATPDGEGYWVFTTTGRALPVGSAPFLGDMDGVALNGPVLDSIATLTGRGYYMVASDGGIFTFGDARFGGSMGGTPLNAPVESLVPDPDGQGYWLVASDGGVFAFDAPFRGSMASVPLNAPITGMVPYGNGYLMVAAEGGAFNFSDQPFSGSLGDEPPSAPVVSVAAMR